MEKTKKEVIILFLIFVLILNFSFISASFEVGNLSNSIQEFYGPSNYIKGWINISLEDEPVNSLFEGGEGDPISLIDLIKLNNWKEEDYICNPLNCETSYSAVDGTGTLSKIFNLDKGDSAIFGLKLTGNITSVNSIDFTLSSGVSSSCYNQLKIDFLNNDKIDIANNKSLDSHCISGTDYLLKSDGCFNKDEELMDRNIFETPYCQRIKLTESPGFWLGVNITIESSEDPDDELTMELYDISSGRAIENGKCNLQIDEISEEWEEVSCDIDYLVTKQKDHYVCIYSNQEASGKYKIKGNKNPSTQCGFYGVPIEDEVSAYQIFAEGKRFAAVGTLYVSNSLPNEDETLGGKAHEYLMKLYYNKITKFIDCSNDCIIPIEFISGNLDQTITLTGLTISYIDSGGPGEDDKFYNLSTGTQATIDANFQKLYLDKGNFSVRDDFGDYTFILELGGEEIFSKEISVGKIPEIKNLKPRTTASAYPTEFEVTVESETDIIEYKWEFGDNDTDTTSTNKVTHIYDSIGKYKLKVTITDEGQISSSKTFEIDVGSPIEIINKLLKKMVEDLSNTKEQIEEFPSFSKDSLKSIIDTDSIEEKLEEIQQANASCENACSDEDYNSILTELLKLNVPESITTSMSADSISYYPDENNIDLDILKIIGGGDYDASDEDKYIEAIFGWNQENMDTKITFKELSASYEDIDEPILKIFELNIDKKNESSNPYLILSKLDNIKFKEDYSEREESGYIYIDLDDSQTTITFSTTEDISFIDLPLFISPAIEELSIIESPSERDAQLLKLAIFILILFLLAIIGVVVYIILQEWYKKKYENYLFKNRNDLYNLISYVQSSKKKGIDDKKISHKLRKAGWKFEQINYVMKKYAGKRTGMAEIPVGKILSKFKKEKNILPTPPEKFPTKSKTFTSNFNLKKKKRFL